MTKEKDETNYYYFHLAAYKQNPADYSHFQRSARAPIHRYTNNDTDARKMKMMKKKKNVMNKITVKSSLYF